MKQNTNKSDLGIRTLINVLSAVLIALIIYLAHIPALGWIFASAIAAIGAIAVWEYDQLAKKKGLSPAILLSIIAVISYIFAVFIKAEVPYRYLSSFWDHLPKIVLLATFLACFIRCVIYGIAPITNIATTFFGIIYIAIPLGFFVSIMYFFSRLAGHDSRFEGTWWIIYLIAVTKSSDIGGYFVGRFFGKRKLASKLSPKKTLEGAIGGLICSMLMSLFICYLGKKFGNVFAGFSYLHAIWLGVLMGILGQIGDLAESFLKRDAGVKDSNSLPAVGGVLDMIDSLLFTAPLLFIFLKIVYAP